MGKPQLITIFWTTLWEEVPVTVTVINRGGSTEIYRAYGAPKGDPHTNYHGEALAAEPKAPTTKCFLLWKEWTLC